MEKTTHPVGGLLDTALYLLELNPYGIRKSRYVGLSPGTDARRESGERLAPEDLANQFGVNLRTIQRDLNERFAYLPLQKTEGRYHLDPVFLGKLSTKDIQRFAALAGVRGLFPSLNDDFCAIYLMHVRRKHS